LPKFDANSVSDVEYDFTGWNGIKGSVYDGIPIDDRGTIPEPSSDLVARSMGRMANAFKALDLEIEETPQAVAEAMRKVNDEQSFQKLSGELLDVLDELCDGSPRKESMEALGWRRFMAFVGYVAGELMSPEVGSAGTDNTQRRLKSV
jgi:hypothetical protein